MNGSLGAALDPRKTVEIARAIVTKKIRMEGHERLIEREFLRDLQQAKTTDDVRHVKASAAQIWWSQWTGFKLAFKGAGVPGTGGSIHGAGGRSSNAGHVEFQHR